MLYNESKMVKMDFSHYPANYRIQVTAMGLIPSFFLSYFLKKWKSRARRGNNCLTLSEANHVRLILEKVTQE
jgi:hypothetical protein